MIFVFRFPDIGEGIHEGKILAWYVARGQSVKEGDSLVKVETDKVVADIPAPRSGLVKNIFGKVGQVIHVGAVLAELDVEGEGVAEPEPPKKPSHRETFEEPGFGVVGQIEVADTDAFLPATGEGYEGGAAPAVAPAHRKILASPVARRMARELGLEIGSLRGTGPAGRVMKEDVMRAAASPRGERPPAIAVLPMAASVAPRERVEYEELSQIRKTIAARMAQSKFTAPHLTAFEEVEVSKLVELRHDLKETFAARNVSLSYLPFIIRAAAIALTRHRKLNCRLDLENNRVIYHNFCNIGLAVDTPDGLIVPVIRDADQRSLTDLANTIADYASRARERKLTLHEIREGTFTITNYGSIAGTFGTPIINYPEVAILGIGRIMEKAVVKNGQLAAGHVLPLSVSADHRIVDGGDVARFLLDLTAMLANPVTLLVP